MSLNKGSLDKSQQDQKLDIEYLYHYFIAAANITAGQVVMIDVTATKEVLVATEALKHLTCGVALNSALIGEVVKTCIYGIVEVTAASNIDAGDIVGTGGTIGRVTKRTTRDSGGGSAHTHGSSLTNGAPSTTATVADFDATSVKKYAATSSGGDVTSRFDGSDNYASESVAADDHVHTIGGTIDNESAHTHSFYQGQILGKALETFSAGNTGKILVCFG